MASNPYVKSLIWLVSFGGLGYGLMVLTSPSEAKLAKIKASTPGARLTEDEKRKQEFLKKLQSVAIGNTPNYTTKKEGTD